MRGRRQWIALAAVLLVAAALRLYKLEDLPAGLYCDEAGNGYNAYALGVAGIDENGVHWPLYVWSFGTSYKNPVFIYSAILPVKLLGLSAFSVRLTSALFGIATVAAMFFLGRALFGPWVGFWAALFLALCPWHLHFSRIAFELIALPFLFVSGCVFLVRFTQGRRTLPAALACYAGVRLCVRAGGAVRARVSARFRRAVFRRPAAPLAPVPARHRRRGAAAHAGGGCSSSPGEDRHGVLPPHHVLDSSSRGGRSSSASRTTTAQFFSPRFWSTTAIRSFATPCASSASSIRSTSRSSCSGPARHCLRRDRASKLMLWWLALYPVAPSLMNEIPSATRGIIGAPVLCLLAGVGFASRCVSPLAGGAGRTPGLAPAPVAVPNGQPVPDASMRRATPARVAPAATGARAAGGGGRRGGGGVGVQAATPICTRTSSTIRPTLR